MTAPLHFHASSGGGRPLLFEVALPITVCMSQAQERVSILQFFILNKKQQHLISVCWFLFLRKTNKMKTQLKYLN